MNGLFDWKERFLNLMFLEEDGGAGAGTSTEEDDPPKTFTQEELNGILASEKRKNLSNVYKDLGFEKPEDAKAFVEKYREKEQKEKDDLTKSKEEIERLEKAEKAEKKKAQEAEYRLKAVEAGCDVKNASDIVSIALNRITDDEDFDAVLKEIKESYPSMFDSSSESSDTGTGGNHPRQKNKAKELSGIGKRLAEQKKNNSAKKENSFFK